MADLKEKPAVQSAIDDLKAEVTSPADQEVLDSWQAEQDAARAEHFKDIGEATLPELVVQPDGTVAKKDEAIKDVADGNPSGTYKNGRR
jgi:hypothetical protein